MYVEYLTACAGEGILFILVFLQANLRAAKQAKIRTTSLTDSAVAQELDSSSHLCPVFPDEFIPDPVGQWRQALHFPVSNIFFFKTRFCASASSNLCFYQCWQQYQLLRITALEGFLDPDCFQITLNIK